MNPTLILTVALLAGGAIEAQETLTIAGPAGGNACFREWFTGTTPDPTLNLYLLVRMEGKPRWWISPRGTTTGGEFKVRAFIGDPEGTVDNRFEVMAAGIRNRDAMRKGDTLPYPLPDIKEFVAKSKVITVTRRDCHVKDAAGTPRKLTGEALAAARR